MTKEKCRNELYIRRCLELLYIFMYNLFKTAVSSSGTVQLKDWKGESN
jgi:hypothetical protein